MSTEDLNKKFEGSEKKLEIILKQPNPSLRSNETSKWDSVVASSKAHIIDCVSTREMDAYRIY